MTESKLPFLKLMKILLFIAAFFLALALLLSILPSYRFSMFLSLGFSLVSVLFYYFSSQPTPLNIVLSKVLLGLLILGIVAAGITAGFILKAAHPSERVSCRYFVVLGAGVNGTEPSRSLNERLNAAYNYLCANPESVAILSGGQGRGEDITEAACMYRELTELGISPSRLLLDEQSFSTIENLQFSLELLEKELGFRPDQVGVVSSEYHIFRAKLFAKSLGVEAQGIPAATTRISLRLNYFLREIAAVWKYLLLGP